MLQCKTKWKNKKLGSICNYITTGKLDASAMVGGGQYRFYTCAENYYHIDTYAFEGQSLLISGNGANVGYIHYYNGKFNAYQRTYVLQNFEENIFYIKHYLKAYLKERITKEVNAGNIPFIKLDTLTDMEIYYPTNPKDQIKIANILSTCDKVIEKTEDTIRKYKQIKAGIMQDLFTRGLDKNGKLRPTYEQSPDVYKYSKELAHHIPKDWNIKKLNEIGDIVTGSTPSTQNLSYYGDEYMFVSPADIDEDRYIKTTLKYLSLKGFNISRKIPANSVCVVCIGSTIGKEAISEKGCTTNQQINTIIPFNGDFSLYYYYSTCLYLKKQFDANVGLQAVPIVNKSNFEEFYIPEPKDEKEVVKIQSIVNQFDEKIEIEEQYLNKYKQIKQGLMKRLLTPPNDAEIIKEE